MILSEPRAIIFWGDISGFTTWSSRVRRTAVRALLFDTYLIYRRWAAKHGFWIKMQGDGLIAVRELLPANDRNKIIASLHDSWHLVNLVNSYLAGMTYPRPPMFRIRAVLGDLWKIREAQSTIDYVGYQMDFGFRIQDVCKEDRCVMSEAVFDGLGRRGCPHLKIARIETGDLNLAGVYPEDQRNFYRYDFKGREHEDR